MRILFVVPYAPNLIRVRPYQFIRGVARRGHEVVVASLWAGEEERAALDALAGAGVRVVARRLTKLHSLVNCARGLLGSAPLQSAYSWQPAFMDDLSRLLHETRFDAVHVEHVRGARYGMGLKALTTATGDPNARDVPIVWDSVDCISHLYGQATRHSRCLKGRLMGLLDASRTEGLEAAAVRVFDRVLLTSPLEASALARVAESRGAPAPENLRVICNGVDLDYFGRNGTDRDPATLVFTGKMSYHANITAVKHLLRDIMPLVWDRRPDVKLVVAGKNPPACLRALCDRCGTFDGCRRVTVTGTVADIRPYLWRATAAVVPIVYGAGVQNKVLEAMATATPVVAAPVAVSALNARPGLDVLVGADPAAFARHTLSLIGNGSLCAEIGYSGRRYVEQRHSWEAAAASLEDCYLEAGRDKVAPPPPVHAYALGV